jgi:glutathione S-transferase
LLSLLGLEYQLTPVDLMKGEHRQPEFLRLNPLGQVPVLVDGNLVIRDAQAILIYLARRYGNESWLPLEAEAMGRVMQWLFLSASEIHVGLESARLYHLLGLSAINIEQATQKAKDVLQIVDRHLDRRLWLELERPTIADIACYPYINLASDAQIDLNPYPNLGAWMNRIEQLPGYTAMSGASA